MPTPPRAFRWAALLASLLPAAACGDRTDDPGGAAAASSTAVTATPTTRRLDPAWDVGQRVEISHEGFRPHELVSTLGEAVEFANLTDGSVQLRSVGSEIESGPILPGDVWKWVPGATGSTAFFLVGAPSTKGVILVEPPDSQF